MRWKGGRAVFIFTGQRKERVSSKPRRFKVSVCSREKHSMDFSNQTAFKKKNHVSERRPVQGGREVLNPV